MKRSIAVEDPLRPVEVETAESENHIDRSSGGARQTRGLEWAWLLWLNRSVLARWVLYGAVVAIITALLIPVQYESTTRLMPAEPPSSGLAMMAAMAGSGGGGASSLLGGSALGGVASDLLGAHDPGAVWSDMLKGRTILDRIIERFDLRKVYRVRYWDKARKRLASRTEISLDRKSGVTTITVTDNDQKRAQQIAQAYVDELDRLVALVSTSSARRERVFLEQRLQQVKHDLDGAASQFAQYASKNTVIDVDSQTKAMVEGAAALQGQLIAAQSELDGLEQIYTENNVRIRSLKARVEELRNQLQKMGGLGANFDPTASNSAQSGSDQLYPSIRKLPLLGVRWLDLYRETKIQETIYQLLTEQYELARIQEAKEIPTVKVLDSPSWPERKSFPPRTLIVVLGALLSLMGGAGWLLAMAAWQDMDLQDPRKQLGQEIGSACSRAWSRLEKRYPLARRIGSRFRRPEAPTESIS